jgi:hypothetical protein
MHISQSLSCPVDLLPPRMRWATYNRLTDRLVAADGVADELAARLLGSDPGAADMSGTGHGLSTLLP